MVDSSGEFFAERFVQPKVITEPFSLMREYFASLGDSAHPDSKDPRSRAITRFQELLLVSFREFSIITDEMIQSERKRFRSEIITSIESFAKRSAVRSLKRFGRFSKDQVGLIYDALFKAICIHPELQTQQAQPLLVNTGVAGSDPNKEETRISLKTFRIFLSEIATWARDEKIVSNGFQVINISLITMHRGSRASSGTR